MTIDFEKFIKTAEFKTMDDVMTGFQKCGSFADVEEMCWGNKRPNEAQFGEFEIVDHDDRQFTVAQTYYDPERGKEIRLPYIFNFAEVTEHDFTFEITGNFARAIKLKATSEKEAEEMLDEILKNALCLKHNIDSDKIQTLGDTHYTEVTYDVTNIE